MPPARPGRRSEVAFDIQEGGAGDVPVEVGPAAEARIVQRPTAVHEDVLHL
jgi:hypothetical protein